MLNQAPPRHLLLGLCLKSKLIQLPRFPSCLSPCPDFPYYLASIRSDALCPLHCCLHALRLPVSLTDIWQVEAMCSEWQQTWAKTPLYQNLHDCKLMLQPPLTLRCSATRHYLCARTEVCRGLDIFVDRPQPLQAARTSTVRNVGARLLQKIESAVAELMHVWQL